MLTSTEGSELVKSFIKVSSSTNPNVPPGTTHIPCHPATLSAGFGVDCVFEFPGALDPDKLVLAIQRVATIWPVIAGRHVTLKDHQTDAFHHSKFAIHLTGSDIPFERQSILADRAFPAKAVIVETTDPYITRLQENFSLPDTGAPLLTVRLTTLLPSGRSVLGINWAHILGDGLSVNTFVNHLSHLYSQPASPVPLKMPSFTPHLLLTEYPPSREVQDEASRLPQSRAGYPAEEVSRRFKEDAKSNEMVALHVPVHVLWRMFSDVKSMLPGVGRLSPQDVLNAYWLSLLERITGERITQLTYVVNYRNLPGPFPDNIDSLCANAVSFVDIRFPLPAEEELSHTIKRMAALAMPIREELNSLREDRAKVSDWLAGRCFSLETIANKGHEFCLLPLAGGAFINSNWQYDWQIPFGMDAKRVRYHTEATGSRLCRMFRSNPDSSDPVDKKDGSQLASIELSFRIPRDGGKETMDKLVKEDFAKWQQ